MESGYYTFAKQSSTADKATIESTVKEMAIATSAAMDAKAVERGVLDFVENTKVLMKGLDEVAKLHPFVAGRFSHFFLKNCKSDRGYSGRACV